MKHETQPTFSIVIPVHNNPVDLSACLESISRLDFHSDEFEVIVVDNNSTDDTESVARSFENVTCLSETRLQGSYAARNTGIAAAKGRFIAFTDSDCRVHPDWLSEIEKLSHDPGVGCIAGEILSTNPETLVERFSESIGLLRQKGPLSGWHFKPYAQTANAVFRREVFEQIGLFNGSMKSGGDAEIAWRMLDNTDLRLTFAPDAVVYHHHRASLAELWKQFRRYGGGKLSWASAHEEFVPPDLADLEKQVISLFEESLVSLEAASVSEADAIYPFLKAVSQTAHLLGYQSDMLNHLSGRESAASVYKSALKAMPRCSICGNMSFESGSLACHNCGSSASDRVMFRALTKVGEGNPALLIKKTAGAGKQVRSNRLLPIELADLVSFQDQQIILFQDYDARSDQLSKVQLLQKLTASLSQEGALLICNALGSSSSVIDETAALDADITNLLPFVEVRSSTITDEATGNRFALVVASGQPGLAAKLCLTG